MTPKRTPKDQASAQRLEEDQQSHRRPRRARVGKSTAPEGRPRVNLALQGGGSHGAFTWGVLDRLLDDDGLDFGGVSGTSAGALNGAVLLTGYVRGYQIGGEAAARPAAQKALREFWRDVSRHGPLFSPLSIQANGLFKTEFNFDQFPAYQWLNVFMRSFSPYEFNPLNLNPLEDVLKRHVDPAALHDGCAQCGIPLFVTATSVHTGQARVFTAEGLSLQALMASACLPFVFQAVEIDGEPYWDGGYSANPAVFPLFYECDSPEILLVLLAPPTYGEVPTTVEEIRARAMELAFNTSVLREMLLFANVIDFSERLGLEAGGLEKRILQTHFHLIEAEDLLHQFGSETKVAADWPFLLKLHDLGYAAAEDWLRAHSGDIGVRNSFDLARRFRL